MIPIVFAAALVIAPPSPTAKQLRSATVAGIYDGTTVRLKGGAFKGPPVGATRPRVELVANLTATGELDGMQGDERIALLSKSDGVDDTNLYLAVFALRDKKVANVATILVGAKVQPKALAILGRTIELDVIEPGPTDFACCPTRPARRAYWLEPGGLKAITDVPFELIHDRIVFHASVGSLPDLSFLLDTGADRSTLDQEIAARAGHATLDAFMITGVQIGIEDVPPFDVDVADLSSTSHALGREIGGVLGNDVLRSRILQIDYPRRRLRILPDAPPTPPGALARPMKFVDGGHVPMLEDVVTENGKTIPVAINGRLGNPGLALFVVTLNYRDGQFVIVKP